MKWFANRCLCPEIYIIYQNWKNLKTKSNNRQSVSLKNILNLFFKIYQVILPPKFSPHAFLNPNVYYLLYEIKYTHIGQYFQRKRSSGVWKLRLNLKNYQNWVTNLILNLSNDNSFKCIACHCNKNIPS